MKIVLTVLLLMSFSAQARNGSVLVCKDIAGFTHEIPYKFGYGENPPSLSYGESSDLGYDDCFFNEHALNSEQLDFFNEKFGEVIPIAMCMSHSVGGSSFTFAFYDEFYQIEAVNGSIYTFETDEPIVIHEETQCYDDY